jgi:hypothetical protein
MTIGGWITMILSVGFVVSLFGWSISKVLFGKEPSENYTAWTASIPKTRIQNQGRNSFIEQDVDHGLGYTKGEALTIPRYSAEVRSRPGRD